jgi:hypothetical protein
MSLSQGQEHQPLSPEGVPRAAAVRLRQDRLGAVRESGTVHAGAGRVCAIPRIEQRGKADHQVNPGGTGGKCLEGGEASSALGVEKHAARSDAPESWHKKTPVKLTHAEHPISVPDYAQQLSPSINVELMGGQEVFGRLVDRLIVRR